MSKGVVRASGIFVATRSLPNTVITPHLGYVTEETYRVFYKHAVENIRAYAQGAPIRLVAAPA
jgi:D-3-phosphoglycerate dehydrogenase